MGIIDSMKANSKLKKAIREVQERGGQHPGSLSQALADRVLLETAKPGSTMTDGNREIAVSKDLFIKDSPWQFLYIDKDAMPNESIIKLRKDSLAYFVADCERASRDKGHFVITNTESLITLLALASPEIFDKCGEDLKESINHLRKKAIAEYSKSPTTDITKKKLDDELDLLNTAEEYLKILSENANDYLADHTPNA